MEQLPDFLTLSRMSDADLTKLFGVRDFFQYTLDCGTINAGSTASSTFTVQSDSNFLWQEGMFLATVAAAETTDSSRIIPNITCTILDTGSGRQLSSGPVPISSQFGNGQRPYILPTPRFFRANTQVTVSLVSFEASANVQLKLQFAGTKFFKFAQNI